MILAPDTARNRFAGARVARLATASPDGQPHLVPVTFASYGDTVAIAIDHKPKTTTSLKRLANIEANPLVSLLTDEYSDDWERLWWVRADGTARTEHHGGERTNALARLAERYPQYRERPPDGPVILVRVTRWLGWSFG